MLRVTKVQVFKALKAIKATKGRRGIKVLRVPVSKAPKETKEFREVKEIKAGKAHKDFRALSVPKVTWALRATKEQAFRGPKGHEAASCTGLTLGLAATQESATSCTTTQPSLQ